jgi:subtilisin family serine protease
MDPALQELIRAGQSDDEVAVLLRLDHGLVPKGVRIVARFGPIATARVLRGDIANVHASIGVRSVKAPRLYVPDWIASPVETEVGEIRPSDERRPDGLKETGRGVVVAVVDWGLDFAHPDFRNLDGNSRVLALWDQRARDDGQSNNRYGYGWIHDHRAINSALRSSNPYLQLAYHPADAGKGPTHGTHTTAIAAGNGRGGGPSGMAPECDIIFVHLATATGERGDNLGDSAALFEAIDFIAKAAGDRPWVLSLSMGRHAGPHDQSPLIVQGIDAALSAAPGRACVQSTGNYFSRPIHTQGVLRPGEARDIRFQTGEEDGFAHEIDLWYAGSDRIVAEVIAPEGQPVGKAVTGGRSDLIVKGEKVGRLYNRFRDPNNFDNEALVFLDATAPRGSWTLRLRGVDVVDGRYHCWVERDPACSTCQPRFDPADVEPLSTTGTICNGRLSIAVGAYDAHSPSHALAAFSSAGPTRDGRTKPDLIAPGVDVLSARSASRPPLPEELPIVRMSGTSMAAPYVAGIVALMLQAASRRLPVRQTRELLLAAAEPVTSGESQFRWGSGYANVAEAVAAARDLNSDTRIPPRTKFARLDPTRYTTENLRPGSVSSSATESGAVRQSPARSTSARNPISQERRISVSSSTLVREEPTSSSIPHRHCGCHKKDRNIEEIEITLQELLDAPGLFARRWNRQVTSSGFVVIAGPGEPLDSHPQTGDILIRIVEGGAGHAMRVVSPGLWHADDLPAMGLFPDSEFADGFVHVAPTSSQLEGAAEGRARGIVNTGGQLLDDLLLVRLAMPPTPTTPQVVVQQSTGIPPLSSSDPLSLSLSTVAPADPPAVQDGQAEADQPQEDELSCQHIDASHLSWPAASAQQFDLMRRVYLRQISASCQLRNFIGDVPGSELAEIENGIRARIAAAASCRNLLAAARAALPSDPAASDVSQVGIVSGYRSASQQLSGWNHAFPQYCAETQNDRSAADGGEFGDTAAALLARYISGRLAAPGFSLHNDGRAIDFLTVQGGRSMAASTSASNRKAWRASWFFGWLSGNANVYGFFQNTSIDEPWHWEYRGLPSPTQSVDESAYAFRSTITAPDTNELAGESWLAPAEVTVSKGRQEFRNTPLLTSHRGTQPDLVLRWNDMADPSTVDVIVHLHGYSGYRAQMRLLNKEAYSGLDFSNPTDPSDSRPGRSTPTLGILPRGSYVGDQPGVTNPECYKFPALIAPGAITNLIQYGLNQFQNSVGLSQAVSRGRLILTAHSGGGEALMPIVADAQPDEVHVFDALYWDATRLITWARSRIAAEIAAWTPGKVSADGGLCVLYRKKGTESQSVRVHQALQTAIATAPADAQPILQAAYRVLRTNIAHGEVPRRFGWLLLANVAQPLTETYSPSEAESFAVETVPIEQSSTGPGESYIDTAMNGTTGSDAFFFLADHFVTYSWVTDKVIDGVHPISEWLLPLSIATPGPAGGVDAALNGQRSYLGKAYLFKGPAYARVNVTPRTLESSTGSLADNWKFPETFATGINAAFNGKFSRDGKAYFFKKDRYLRYSWGDASGRGEGVDPTYPRPIGNMLRMPADFASGVEAAVDGDAAFSQYSYLFKKDRYIRFNWNSGGGEPFVDGVAQSIRDKWEGLVELLLAGKAKSQGLEWLKQARDMLKEYADFLGRGAIYPYVAIMNDALSAHFHINLTPSTSSGTIATIQQIASVFDGIETKLAQSSTIFIYKSRTQAAAEGMAGNPAYGVFNGNISFTPDFVSQGPLGRAAMVLHESVHVFDNQSGLPTTHIPEWYVTDAEADRLGLDKSLTSPNRIQFAARYNLMSTPDAQHDPSSYAAFAQHIFYGSDTRYGAGRPNQ